MLKNTLLALILCSLNGLSISCSYFDENSPEALLEKTNEGDVESMYLYSKHIQALEPNEGFIWLEKAASLNHLKAMHEISDLYMERSSKHHNYNLAFIWVEKLAKKGDKFSQSRLGWLYANGQGTRQNYSKAFTWYQKAAEQGDKYSTVYIAWMYFTGAGAGANNEEAFKWFKKSAGLGDKKSQFLLAYLYKHGIGTVADLKQSDFWFDQISPYREELENDRTNIEYFDLDDKTFEQRIKEQAKLNDKFKNQNNEYFNEINDNFYKKFNQGLDYLRGVHGVKNYGRAFQIFNELDTNNKEVSYHLAEMYREGLGTKPDMKKAIQLYELAHEKGHWQAADRLGDIYYFKKHAQPADYKKALDWFSFQYKKGYLGNNYKMANIYANGLGVERDLNKAFKLLDTSVNLGQIETILMMAEFYDKGIGVSTNSRKASFYYSLAAKRGDATAIEKIADDYANGIGSQKDRLKAYNNYLEAIERKSTTAEAKLNKLAVLLDANTQFKLAMEYLHGRLHKSPMNQKDKMGLKWMKEASLNGNYNAKLYLERLDHEDVSIN